MTSLWIGSQLSSLCDALLQLTNLPTGLTIRLEKVAESSNNYVRKEGRVGESLILNNVASALCAPQPVPSLRTTLWWENAAKDVLLEVSTSCSLHPWRMISQHYTTIIKEKLKAMGSPTFWAWRSLGRPHSWRRTLSQSPYFL